MCRLNFRHLGLKFNLMGNPGIDVQSSNLECFMFTQYSCLTLWRLRSIVVAISLVDQFLIGFRCGCTTLDMATPAGEVQSKL